MLLQVLDRPLRTGERGNRERGILYALRADGVSYALRQGGWCLDEFLCPVPISNFGCFVVTLKELERRELQGRPDAFRLLRGLPDAPEKPVESPRQRRCSSAGEALGDGEPLDHGGRV